MPTTYSKGHFKLLQEALKDKAFELLSKCSSVGEMRRLDRKYRLKRNALNIVSKEYAILYKNTKGNISENSLSMSAINDTTNIILKSNDRHVINRSIRLMKAKIRIDIKGFGYYDI